MPRLRLTSDGVRGIDEPRPYRPRVRSDADRFRSTYAWQKARKAQIARQPWCSMCGSERDLTADHVIPLRKGGDPLDPANLDTLCRVCNGEKGAA